MMKKTLLLGLCLLASCQKRGMDSATMFSRSGDLKDKIALASMIDSSSCCQSWSVAKELSDYLEKDLARKDNLYVIPVKEEMQLSANRNPFSKNLAWMNDHFAHTQYVAFTELLKYEISPSIEPALGSFVDMSVRVRVFENTNDGFKTILQEIVQESYMIPSLISKTLSLQPSYNTPGYEISPLGMAHMNFSKLISKRIRDYIKQQ